MFKRNQKGFTLIELMIVIAIIGILAAIAIPNFIEYRNKSFCSRAESDANAIAAAIADYFSIPTHTGLNTITTNTPDTAPLNVKLSGTNTAAIAGTVTSIEITVVDVSGRCPDKYQQAVPYTAASKKDGWDDASDTYYKYMASE
jgi:prepilin-type N-terminal cleavage/methylation domain-containing protein